MKNSAGWVAATAVLVATLLACGREDLTPRLRSDESSSQRDAGQDDAPIASHEVDAGDTFEVPPQPAEAKDNEISVLPVFFVASGAEFTDADFHAQNHRILRHLRTTQRFYLSQLKTETSRSSFFGVKRSQPEIEPRRLAFTWWALYWMKP